MNRGSSVKMDFWHVTFTFDLLTPKAYNFEYIPRSFPVPSLNNCFWTFVSELSWGQRDKQTSKQADKQTDSKILPTTTDMVGVGNDVAEAALTCCTDICRESRSFRHSRKLISVLGNQPDSTSFDNHTTSKQTHLTKQFRTNKTNNIDLINYRRILFNFDLPSTLWCYYTTQYFKLSIACVFCKFYVFFICRCVFVSYLIISRFCSMILKQSNLTCTVRCSYLLLYLPFALKRVAWNRASALASLKRRYFY